jgi:hypothetical protein
MAEITEALWSNLTALVHFDLQALARLSPAAALPPCYRCHYSSKELKGTITVNQIVLKAWIALAAPWLLQFSRISAALGGPHPSSRNGLLCTFKFFFASFLLTEGNIPVSRPYGVQPWLWTLCLTGGKSFLVHMEFFSEHFKASNANTEWQLLEGAYNP